MYITVLFSNYFTHIKCSPIENVDLFKLVQEFPVRFAVKDKGPSNWNRITFLRIVGGGKALFKVGGGGGEAFFKLEAEWRAQFDCFSKGG